MRVLIVSDTHRQNDNFLRVVERERPIDLVIHCGDSEGSEYLICESSGCPVHIVCGNNDFFSELPREIELEIGKYKALITHGHNYYVSMDNETLKKYAMSKDKNLVFYGHTHRPVIDIKKNIIAINPGSLSYPRQDGKRPTYIIMDISEDGEAHFEIKFV
ncbi:MAG: metallophosphoesterase family protein [Lachnospiraceae bacterium]|nr:metallophosphoesterase family protein [Lachnospiraceae bacterium]